MTEDMGSREFTYLNNAATSFPKPEIVLKTISSALVNPPQEPGRTGSSSDPLTLCRQALSNLLDVGDTNRVALLPSATYALNQVLQGLLSKGGHAISTSIEHNSMLRPLAYANRRWSVNVTYIEPGNDGHICSADIAGALTNNTCVIAITHASNVTGVVTPIAEVADIAARHEVPLLIDCAQSAGALDISHADFPGRVFIVVAGHKGLYGPAGTGALILPDDRLDQTIHGGTGIHSEMQEHPRDLPLRHEAGTPNLSGFAGLAAGVQWVAKQSVKQLGSHRARLVIALREGLASLDRRIVIFPQGANIQEEDTRCGVVSFSMPGIEPREVGFILQEAFDIEVRTGLHCAPRIHELLGSGRSGTVRVSFGAFNTFEHVDRILRALAEILP
jgi:selenocysteine lyase/cysteine desulfurase